MSIKPLIQILITSLILLIIVGVYYEYFNVNKKNVTVINNSTENVKDKFYELEKKINELEIENRELTSKINEKKNDIIDKNLENIKNNNSITIQSDPVKEKKEKKKTVNKDVAKNSNERILKKKDNKNLVKDVEYTSVDEKGNKFYLLASSGKSNVKDNNILDLINVRGKITSETRDTIYIVSDFAQYNSANLNSKFYQNVIIDYQDKKITCENFDINMETNMAIAYNNVVITDPKSVMKAGIVEFDLKTKDINIKPKSITDEIEVVTN